MDKKDVPSSRLQENHNLNNISECYIGNISECYVNLLMEF